MKSNPHIAIPEPTSFDHAYNQRGWPQYARAVEFAGGVAVPVPLTESPATVAKIVAGCAGVLLPGSGADLDPLKYGQKSHPESADPDPARETVDEILLREAFNQRKPILGICYGLQSLNVWRHGSLRQHVLEHAPGRDVHEAHPLRVENPSQLAEILGVRDAAPKVNSSHHQAVATVGDGLAIVARSEPDGIIEALEGTSADQFVLGVQWHPERTLTIQASSRAIFDAFVKAAREWKPRPILESAREPVAR
jgi:putative glutamine amidotransferase